MALVLAVAALLQPGVGELGLFGLSLPVVCTLRAATGWLCPGCGLTRSFVATVHGDWSAGFALHPIGPPLLIWVVLEGIRHGMWLLAPSHRVTIDRFGWWLDRAGLLLVPALAIAWVVRV